MRFGVRRPSIRGRISARTSWKRHVRHSMGIKAPRGMGWFTNPKKALYNRVYNRTTISVDRLFKVPRSSTKVPAFGARLPSDGSAPLGGWRDYVPTTPTGEVNVANCIILALIASAPSFFLMWLGVSAKWAFILPIGLVILGVLAPYIILLGQLAFCLFILYLLVNIFILH